MYLIIFNYVFNGIAEMHSKSVHFPMFYGQGGLNEGKRACGGLFWVRKACGLGVMPFAGLCVELNKQFPFISIYFTSQPVLCLFLTGESVSTRMTARI